MSRASGRPIHLAAALTVALAGCAASDDPATLRALEADRKALQVRMEQVEVASARDLAVRDLRRAALRGLRALSAEDVTGDGAFVLVRPSYFEKLVTALVPIRTSVAGYDWTFAEPTVAAEADGLHLTLRFQARSPDVRRRLGRAARGKLEALLTPTTGADGVTSVRAVPTRLTLDDRDFRVAPAIQRAGGAALFGDLLPRLSVALAPTDHARFGERKIPLRLSIAESGPVVVSQGLLIPFRWALP